MACASGLLRSLHIARSEEGPTLPDRDAGHQALPVKGMGHRLGANLKGPRPIPAGQAEQLSMVLPPVPPCSSMCKASCFLSVLTGSEALLGLSHKGPSLGREYQEQQAQDRDTLSGHP